MSEPANVPRNQANPVRVSRAPTRLSGRPDHAANPHTISASPAARSPPACKRLCPGRASHSATKPSTIPAGHSACLARREAPPPSSGNQRTQSAPRQLTLGDKATNRTSGQPPSVRRNITGGHQHHLRRVGSRSQPRRHLEAVSARQLDIQHYHPRAKARGSIQRRCRVPRFPDHLKTFRLQQRLSKRPEAIMVIDDQHRAGHPQMVARCATVTSGPALYFRTGPGVAAPPSADRG